jgi:hypothetical protein
MKHGASQLENACLAVVDAIAEVGYAVGWRVRFRAAQLLIAHLTQSMPTVQVVRGIVYGR